jgi:ESX secretion system ATPase EccB
MASRQDQLHSYQFTVQRVVSALVAGETDPARSPVRRAAGAIMAGVLLAAVTLAAGAVYGMLAPGHATNWRDGTSVIVERESGARYVWVGGQLHPVPNHTSALLVIGSAQAHTVSVARAALAGVPRGTPLGIAGAPDPLPPADRLLPAPWTLCSAKLGDGPADAVLYLGRPPSGGTELSESTGYLVTTPDGTDYLVWQHTRYRISRFALGALAWGAEDPTVVAPALVNSLAAGPDLAPPAVPGPRGAPSQVPRAQIGQVVAETVPGGGKQYAVALADRLAGVSELQAALLLAQSGMAELELPPGDFTRYLTGPPLTPTGPAAPPPRRPDLARPHAAERGTCATAGGTRDVFSYDVPVAADGVPVTPAAPAGGAVVPAVTADRVVVQPGRGAVVSAAGALSVISELGIRYPVPGADVLGILGYGGVTPVVMPPALVSLLPVGPALDPTVARTPAG